MKYVKAQKYLLDYLGWEEKHMTVEPAMYKVNGYTVKELLEVIESAIDKELEVKQ